MPEGGLAQGKVSWENQQIAVSTPGIGALYNRPPLYKGVREGGWLIWAGPGSGVVPGVAIPPVSQHTGAKVQEYCLPSPRQCSGAPNRFLKPLTRLLPWPASTRLSCRLRARVLALTSTTSGRGRW